MDNQHTLIKGYRDLTQQEIAILNMIKLRAEEIGRLFDLLRGAPPVPGELEDERSVDRAIVNVLQHRSNATYIQEYLAAGNVPDPRWLAIAQTDLQKGFMFWVRSIAKPGSF